MDPGKDIDDVTIPVYIAITDTADADPPQLKLPATYPSPVPPLVLTMKSIWVPLSKLRRALSNTAGGQPTY